jgi:hypothetical protein
MKSKQASALRSARCRAVIDFLPFAGILALASLLVACPPNKLLDSIIKEQADQAGTSAQGQVATPQFTPPAGSYGSAQSVSISSSTDTAAIRYTLDGTTPTEFVGNLYVSGNPVPVADSCTVEAIAYKDGMSNSGVAVGVYVINGQLPAPSFNPSGGNYTSAQNVAINFYDGTVRYTTDGSEPTDSHGTVYSPGSWIALSSNCTLKAIACKSGWAVSKTTSANYAFIPPNAPNISSVVGGNHKVTISWNPVAGAFFYNLYWAQGSVVTTAGTLVSNSTSPHVVSGFVDGTQYAFIVTAVGVFGESAASAIVTSTTARWLSVGPNTISGYSNSSRGALSLAIGTNGTPFLAYINENKPVVIKYNGSFWEWLGDQYGAGLAWPGSIASFVLDPVANIPYLCYMSYETKAVVAKYNGTNWSTVYTSSGQTCWLCQDSLALGPYGAGPIMVYMDFTTNKAMVERETGNTEQVSTLAVGATHICAEGYYVAFEDASGITVARHGVSGWETVGNPHFASGISYLALGPGYKPWVAITDYDGNATVLKYDGSKWDTVGSTGFAQAANPRLAFALDGTPYVSFGDMSFSPYRASVMKYDGSGWVRIGDAIAPNIHDGAPSNYIFFTAIAIDSNGVPYLAFQDEYNQIERYQENVMKFSIAP